MLRAAATVVALLLTFSAYAQDFEAHLTIREHKFEPAELTVPAGQKIKLLVENQDATPEEFESNELNREKIVVGKGTITVFLGPLMPAATRSSAISTRKPRRACWWRDRPIGIQRCSVPDSVFREVLGSADRQHRLQRRAACRAGRWVAAHRRGRRRRDRRALSPVQSPPRSAAWAGTVQREHPARRGGDDRLACDLDGQPRRKLATQMKSVGNAVQSGSRPLSALLIVVADRGAARGFGVVLFLYGQAASGAGAIEIVGGIALGVIGGVAVGFLLYFGLLGIPMRYFFSATNWLMLLLAAGLASQAARFLIQADILPALGARIWDSSAILSDRSYIGQALHTLIGYDARPAGMQLLFYAITAVAIAVGMKLWGGPSRRVTTHGPTPAMPAR
jgi:hypothetical protein